MHFAFSADSVEKVIASDVIVHFKIERSSKSQCKGLQSRAIILDGYHHAGGSVKSILLAVWLTLSSALMAFLMSTHMGVFKGQTLSDGFPKESGDKKIFLHFLYAGCGCSRDIAARLSKLSENKNEIHQVYWIEDDENAPPAFPGFIELHSLSDTDPKLAKIHGAPQLHVYQAGRSVYQGGYTNTKATYLTDWVVDELRKNRRPAAAPIKGCYIPKDRDGFIATLWKKII